MRAVLSEGRTRAQDGPSGIRPGWRVQQRRQTAESSGVAPRVHPALHPVLGARVSVQGRQLQTVKLSEDETSRCSHQNLQTKDERCLPDLQAAHRSVLLPRQTLSGNQVSRSFLREHQAEVAATAVAAPPAAGTDAETSHGNHDSTYCNHVITTHQPTFAGHKQLNSTEHYESRSGYQPRSWRRKAGPGSEPCGRAGCQASTAGRPETSCQLPTTATTTTSSANATTTAVEASRSSRTDEPQHAGQPAAAHGPTAAGSAVATADVPKPDRWRWQAGADADPGNVGYDNAEPRRESGSGDTEAGGGAAAGSAATSHDAQVTTNANSAVSSPPDPQEQPATHVCLHQTGRPCVSV